MTSHDDGEWPGYDPNQPNGKIAFAITVALLSIAMLIKSIWG